MEIPGDFGLLGLHYPSLHFQMRSWRLAFSCPARSGRIVVHSEAILGPALRIASRIGPEKSASRKLAFCSTLVGPPSENPVSQDLANRWPEKLEGRAVMCHAAVTAGKHFMQDSQVVNDGFPRQSETRQYSPRRGRHTRRRADQISPAKKKWMVRRSPRNRDCETREPEQEGPN
jgi:hypothetical protein